MVCVGSICTEVPEIQDVSHSKSLAPPLQSKQLGRIGSNFSWKPLGILLSGSPRRFLNFDLEAEI